MTNVFFKIVQKKITREQKENRKRTCADIMEQLKTDTKLIEKVITCDETWIFQYNPESKRQFVHWERTSPRRKNL